MTVCISARGAGRILVVGQNPDGQDDLAGQPFVGRSGRFVESMLTDAGYAPGEYWLSNAVRCKTPDRNRQPFPDEVAACRAWLKDEIHRIQPTTIIALGDTALQSLCKLSGITGKRGQELALHTDFAYPCPVYATFHPAYLLRPTGAALRRTAVQDLIKARTGVGEPDPIAWEWWDGHRLTGILSYDIETDALHGGKGDIVQVAVSDGDLTFVARGDKMWDLLNYMQGMHVIGHFGWTFDGHEIAQQMGIKLKYGDDTAALAYLDDETQPLGLESLCVKYLNVLGWKEGIHAALDSDEFAAYNARDAYYTWKLRDHLVKLLGDRVKIHDIIMRPMRRTLDACKRRGLQIDRDVVDARRIVNAAKLERLRTEISGNAFRCESGGIALRPWTDINPNASAQVAEALANEGHRLPLSKKTGKPGAPVSALNDLEPTPLVEAIKEHRIIQKEQSGFVTPYLKVCDFGDGRTHSDYDIWRTLTGRSNAKNKNVQQLDRELRDFFTARDGCELASADLNAVEFWMAAFVAGAQTILARKIADPSWDPHTYFASVFYNVSEDEVNAGRKDPNGKRQVAKSANFSQLYLGGAATLYNYARKMGIILEMKTCEALHALWHEVFHEFNGGGSPYPGGHGIKLGGWYGDVWAELAATGQARTITGFIRHFGVWDDLPFNSKLEALRQAANVKVQGPAAHVAFIGGAALLRAKLPVNGFFHDAYTMEMPEGETSTNENLIRHCLCAVPVAVLKKHFGVDLPPQLLGVEIKVQKRAEAS